MDCYYAGTIGFNVFLFAVFDGHGPFGHILS